MNIYKLRNFGKCQKYLFKFRSAHSAAKPDATIEVLTKQDAKLSQSSAGITVASVENYNPISLVSVAVKAGARYESPETLGISHSLRTCATLSSRKHSAFGITRNLEIKGSSLDVSATREHIVYTLQCVRDEIDSGLELLAEVSANQAFKQWEINDSVYRMELDVALLDNNVEAILLEALHKAAFRGGLANSLVCPSFMLGKFNSEDLHKYHRDNFVTPKTCVVGLGVNHDNLQNAVSRLFDLSSTSGPDGASKFGGGEVRIEKDIPLVHTAIVAEGSGLQNAKDVLSLGVLQCLFGAGANTKLGGSAFTKLGAAAAKSTNNPFNVSCLNINYSDTGIFGVNITGAPGDMKQIVKSVVSEMREVTKSLNEGDVQTAKHQLKAKIRMERDLSKDLFSEMIIDTANYGQIRDIKDIERSIDELTVSDISVVATRVMKTKPAMASVGRLHATPHVDELV